MIYHIGSPDFEKLPYHLAKPSGRSGRCPWAK